MWEPAWTDELCPDRILHSWYKETVFTQNWLIWTILIDMLASCLRNTHAVNK